MDNDVILVKGVLTELVARVAYFKTDCKVPRFTIVQRHLHSALKWTPEEVKRRTAHYKKDKLLTENEHGNLCDSIERIYEHLMKTVKSKKSEDILEGLEKLCSGGHISYDQRQAFIRLNLGE